MAPSLAALVQPSVTSTLVDEYVDGRDQTTDNCITTYWRKHGETLQVERIEVFDDFIEVMLHIVI